MKTFDDRLRRGLRDAEPPADPSGVVDRVLRRAARRHARHRVGVVVMAFSVIAGSIAGVYGLSRVFREGAPPDVVEPGVSNGVIVVSRQIPGEGEQLFAVAPDGSEMRRLTPDGRAVYESPDVSPDGQTIVVAHAIPSFEPGLSVLALLPIDGGSPEWLTEVHVFRDPAWSPDGSKIAFAGSVSEPFGIYVFNFDTGDIEIVSGTDEVSVGHPTWSPDGNRIAFEGSMDSDTSPNQNWDIYSVRVDGSDLTNLTNTRNESETMPAWSWAIDRIAFVAAGPAEGGLASIAPDGTDPQRVWDGENIPNDPVWSPDGERLAFWVGTGQVDTGQVYTVRVDGTDLQPVASAMGALAWSIVADDSPVVPTPIQTRTPSPTPIGEDVGLGFPVCNITRIGGTFAPGVTGTAYVATKAGDTACPQPGDGMQVLAVDVSGDGLAEASYGPLECESWCSGYAAPDVDGDGIDEVFVQNIEFSVAGLNLFDVNIRGNEVHVSPVTVEPPGDAEMAFQGFDGSKEPQFWIGGDGFGSDALRCEVSAGGRVLISSRAQIVPPDTPSSVWQVHETTFVLNGGVLRVVGVRDYEEPFQAGPGSRPSFTRATGCGADLDPYH